MQNSDNINELTTNQSLYLPLQSVDTRYMDYSASHRTDSHALNYAHATVFPHHLSHQNSSNIQPNYYIHNFSNTEDIHIASNDSIIRKSNSEYRRLHSLCPEEKSDIKPKVETISSQQKNSCVGGRGQLKESAANNALGKKTKGRVKIKMEFIDNKLRRYTTFSKRKTGIMKKAYELSTLTGTQVMLLVASETGHVYTFATRKLQPMITSDAGKALIQTCLNSPDPPPTSNTSEQRMSATGYEETDLTYNINDDEHSSKTKSRMHGTHYPVTVGNTIMSMNLNHCDHMNILYSSNNLHTSPLPSPHSPYSTFSITQTSAMQPSSSNIIAMNPR